MPSRPFDLTPTKYLDHRPMVPGLLGVSLCVLGSVGAAQAPPEPVQSRFGGAQLAMPHDVIVGDPGANAQRNAYYGDLHVHTTYSFDAFAFGTLATPYDAYTIHDVRRL